jgi:hypothetical protein
MMSDLLLAVENERSKQRKREVVLQVEVIAFSFTCK